MNKIKAIWTCVISFKPKVVSTVEAIYKSLFILINIMTSAITTASKLKLDTSALTKLLPYIEKVKSAVSKLSKHLGITLSETLEDEVIEVVAADAKSFKRAMKSKDKTTVTMSDVFESYTAAFNKIDEILDK